MQQIRRDLKRCGIYMIINLVNGHRYIGSSKDMQQRLQSHRAVLRGNKHYNPHLQRAWNMYTEKNFEYSILEFCNPEERIAREQYYVDTLNPEYNISKEIVDLPPYTEESNKKHSETRKRKIASGEIALTHNTPVYVYQKDGSFVGRWESIRKASSALQVGENTIWRVLAGICVQGRGYKFFTTEQEYVAPFSKPTNSGKVDLRKIFIVSDGTTTKEFKGLAAVAEYFNTSVKNLRQYVNKTTKYKRKYTIKSTCRVTEQSVI